MNRIFVSASLGAACLCALTTGFVSAQTTEAPVAEATAPSARNIPSLTPVRIEILDALDSQTSKIGAHFIIKLASPIVIVGGGEIPAGALGVGEVVHAAKSRFAGKAGELILAARYIDHDGIRIPLRSFTFAAPTHALDNSGAAAAVAITLGLPALLITGGEVRVPVGTIAYAKTSALVTIPTQPNETTNREGRLTP